jgi:head-tail adaptor
MRLVHTITIQRATAGAPADDWNQASQTWATIATTKGLVQPKSVTEQDRLGEGGIVTSDHSIYVGPTTDVDEADRIVYAGQTYQIDGIERRTYGKLQHLKLNATKVQL